MVKNPSAMRETWVWSLGWEDTLEEGMGTHSSVLAWRITMDKEAWWSYSPWGHKESDMTEWLCMHLYEVGWHYWGVIANTVMGDVIFPFYMSSKIRSWMKSSIIKIFLLKVITVIYKNLPRVGRAQSKPAAWWDSSSCLLKVDDMFYSCELHRTLCGKSHNTLSRWAAVTTSWGVFISFFLRHILTCFWRLFLQIEHNLGKLKIKS